MKGRSKSNKASSNIAIPRNQPSFSRSSSDPTSSRRESNGLTEYLNKWSWFPSLYSSLRLMMSTPHKFTDEPTWMMGQCYKYMKSSQAEKAENSTAKQFLRHFRSRIWVTYRKGFPEISSSKYTSDAGWGCMLRSGQMILAQGLLDHALGRDWRLVKENKAYYDLLRSFLDFPIYECPFSIHNLLVAGRCFDKPVGQWFGPHAACYMLQQCMDSQETGPKVMVSGDGTIYLESILSTCTDPDSDNDAQKDDEAAPKESRSKILSEGKDSQTNTTGAGAGAGEDQSDGKDEKVKELWRPLIILIPVRLGVEKINPVYLEGILRCFQFRQSIGIIGGKPRSSLYFVGFQGKHLLYLDPHHVQQSVPGTANASKYSHTFHCDDVLSTPISNVDPSIALGFYCRDREDFDDFWAHASALLSDNEYPIFRISNGGPPNYDAIDKEDNSSDFSANDSDDDDFVLI